MPHVPGYRSPTGYNYPGPGSVLMASQGICRGLLGHWLPQQAPKNPSNTPVYSTVPRGDIAIPTCNGGLPMVPSSRFGYVWNFDGTGKITFYDTGTPSAPILRLNLAPFEFTVSMWIKNASVSGTLMNFGGQSPNNTSFSQWNLRQNGTSQTLSFQVRDSADVAYTATSTRALGDNAWHHIAGTWDSKFVKCYVDGNLEGSTAYSATLRPDTLVNGLLIGDYGADAQRYNGLMAGFMMWRRCLQDGEIKTLHQDPFSMYLARGIIPEGIPIPAALVSPHWNQFGVITRTVP